MLQRTIFTFLGRLGLVLASLSGLPALAQPELIYKVPAWQFSIDKASHGELKAIPGGSVRIHAITRDPLFVFAKFTSVKGRIEVTQVIVHFHSDRAGGSLASVEIKDPQSGNVLDPTTGGSGKLISNPSGISTYTRQIPPTKPPKTIGAEAVIRLQIGSSWPIESDSGIGEPLDLIEVEVFYKNPALKLPTPSTTMNPNSAGGARVTVPPPAPSAPPARPAPPAASIPNIPNSKGVIYIVNYANELLWYRHDGRADGSFQWAAEGSRVGIGWNFPRVIGGGDGVMYAITPEGDLKWYRHAGGGNGSFNWPQPQGQVVNSGFRGMQVVAAGHGVLYALNHKTGDLLWYRHDGYADGTDRWTAREGRVIASNWRGVDLFAGDAGTLYGVMHGDLYRFHYEGRADGSGTLPFDQGQMIASNWNKYLFFFSSGDGVIYALNSETQELLWFRDEGYKDGTVRWASEGPKVVGHGWQFHTIFSGATLQP